jgi:DNA polymerase-3 subunit alpha
LISAPKKFVGLHGHCMTSTFDGLDYPQDHIDFCIENGLDGWALTDHGNMNGFGHAWFHYEKLKKAGVNFKYIPGCEMYLHPDLLQWRRDAEDAKAAALQRKADRQSAKDMKKRREDVGIITPLTAIVDESDETIDLGLDEGAALTIENEEETKSTKFYNPVNRRHHLVVLPKNSRGLEALFGLISRSYKEGFYRFPRIDFKMLRDAATKGDLLLSTACIGGALAWDCFHELQGVEFNELKWNLLNDKSLLDRMVNRMAGTFNMMADCVGRENVFLELQFNKLAAQHLANRALIEFASRNGLTNQLVVTCDSHYSRPERWKEREIYKLLGRGGNYDQLGPESIPKSREDLKCELYPKNATQVWETFLQTSNGMDFYDSGVVKDAIERTWDIAHEMIGDIRPDTTPKLPSYVVPEDKTPIGALADAVKDGLRKKGLHTNPTYVARAKYELGVIKDRKFAEYFLTMKKIVDIAKEEMFLGLGRGSAAGSLVCYVLDITGIDPIKYNLIFERFLSPDRVEMPDIDTDCENRDLLFDLMREKLGTENVIPISNYLTFKLKTLVRDISRLYSIPLEEVNDALRTVEEDVKAATHKVGEDKNLFVLTYDDAIQHSPSFKTFVDAHPEVVESISVLFKQNKALGRHAGGVIVSERIAERMPMITARGEMQTPWVEGMHYKHLESLGWIKFDLLGLETLRVIHRAEDLLIMNKGKARGGRVEITLDSGEKKFLFGDQLITTSRGRIRADQLLPDDDIEEIPLYQ